MKKQLNTYRQGDVLIEQIEKLPKKLKRQKPENGRIILARGEATGHHHSLEVDDADHWKNEMGERFLTVKGRSIIADLPIEQRFKKQVFVRHPDFGLISFHKGDIGISGERATISGNFGLVEHQEHTTEAIPAKTYRVVRQREYTPEAIRNVAD